MSVRSSADIPLNPRQLIAADLSEVAAAFEDFVSPVARHGYMKRGGQPHPGKPRPGKWPVAARVESSFTPPQQEYNRATLSALFSLAQGKPLVRSEHPFEELTGQFVRRFFAQPPAEASFARAANDTVLGLYKDFAERHANLMPSLRAMGRTGLIGGMMIIEGDTTRMLSRAIKRRLEKPEETLASLRRGITALRPNAAAHHFTESHDYQPSPIQVWCPALKVAQLILNQASAAATTIAHSSELPTPYNERADDLYTIKNPLALALTEIING